MARLEAVLRHDAELPLAPLARITLEEVRHVQPEVLRRQPQLLHRAEQLALGLGQCLLGHDEVVEVESKLLELHLHACAWLAWVRVSRAIVGADGRDRLSRHLPRVRVRIRVKVRVQDQG